jgi:octaprenyl-diphosphate synthase
MTIHRLRALVSEDFNAVNTFILDKIQSQHGLIDDLGNHIVQSGGKRLRPLLVLLACHACNYQGSDHIKMAAMIEFFHTATLLHDDVVDESTLRRGRETANEIWGSKASILVGDYFLTLYIKLMLEIGNSKITQLLIDISHQMTCGEIKQLSNRHKATPSVDDYFDVIRSKTSLLFAGSSAIGALITQSDEKTVDSFYTYGLHLGNAFQLIDDALDYCSDTQTLGKNIGDDLAEGKATLPLLHALQHGSPSQKLKIQESLTKGTLDYLPEVQQAILDTNAVEYTRSIAANEVELAISALQIIPNSVYKDALIEIAGYALGRDH